MEKSGKSFEKWKIWYRDKMKSGKFLKNVLEFGESEKSGKKWEKCKNLLKV